MSKSRSCIKGVFSFALVGALTAAGQESQMDAAAGDGSTTPKELAGMSILGNNEAPKSLVIVPWKSSEIGDGIGVANMLDGGMHPVDKEVFARQLDYWELRTQPSGSPTIGGTERIARND